jgi:hypothetical protein
MEKPRLGQIITVSKIYKREKVRLVGDFTFYRKTMNRKWAEKEIKPVECMIIGIRTITNGIGLNSEEGMFYEQLEWIKSIVVVKSLSSKPFNVPYSEFTKLF